jgi:hypothetical protein
MNEIEMLRETDEVPFIRQNFHARHVDYARVLTVLARRWVSMMMEHFAVACLYHGRNKYNGRYQLHQKPWIDNLVPLMCTTTLLSIPKTYIHDSISERSTKPHIIIIVET